MFGQKETQDKMEKYETEVKKLKEDIKELKTDSSNNNKILKEISAHLISISQGQNSLLEASEKATKSIEEKSENFDRIIRKLEQTNLELQQKTFSKISNTVEDELSKIKTDVAKYNSLKEELSQITKNLELLKTQLNNFNIIASRIKEKDFELVNYANRIDNLEKEKYRLVQESEHVKDILAKMSKARGNFQSNRPFNRPHHPQSNNNSEAGK